MSVTQEVSSERRSLANVELFRELDPAERQRIEQRCRWRRYAPHEPIIDRSSDSHDVYFIVTGRARVVDYAASGREISFEDIQDGGVFGELAAIDGGERSAYVVALNTTEVASLPSRTFIDVMVDHPEVAIAMMHRLTRMVRQASQRIMELSTVGAHNRVHAEMLRLARHSLRDPKAGTPEGTGPNTARISPIPVHADLASRVSTTRETVARVLSDLTKDGLIKRDRNALVVTDLQRLAALVGQIRQD
jgi:CRP-like cAMP-binding protein